MFAEQLFFLIAIEIYGYSLKHHLKSSTTRMHFFLKKNVNETNCFEYLDNIYWQIAIQVTIVVFLRES